MNKEKLEHDIKKLEDVMDYLAGQEGIINRLPIGQKTKDNYFKLNNSVIRNLNSVIVDIERTIPYLESKEVILA